MAGNPLVVLGSLNRLQASVVWASNPSLNVTASYLGKMGIHLALEDESVKYIQVMAGAVTSPEPYMMIRATIHLLKTQALANAYKALMESSALIGNGLITPDSVSLPVYQITNCAVSSVQELNFSGDDAGWNVVCRGYYLVNSSLWG